MSLLARTALAAMGVNLTVDEELTLYCEFGDLDGIIKIVKKEGFHYLFKFLEPGLIVSAWGGGNLLHLACRCGWDHIVEYLMGFKDVAVNQYSEHLGTPLHLAAQYGYPKCVQILLNHPEIDVNAPFNWIIWTYRTPLMCAAQSGHVSCVSLLLNHPDVQVNLQDAEGNTALHLAVEELFHHRYLEKGEDLHIPNYSNYVSLLFHLGDMEQGQELNIPNYSNYLGKEAYRSCVDVLLQCKSIDISIRNLRGLDIGLLINETSNKIGSRVLPSSLTRFLSGHTILEKLTNYNVARWNRTNIMLVGQGRAGKTAFTNTLIGRWFRETGSTIGAEMIDLQLYSGSIKQGQWLRQGKLTPNTETENEVEAALKDIYFQQALRSRGPIFSTKLSTTRIGEKKAFDKFGGDEDFPDQMSTLDPERKPIALNHTSSLDETSMTSSLSITDIRFPTVLSWSEQSNQPPSFKLNLLDMGGQPIFNVLHPFFMSSYGVYLVVFDMELFMSKHETYKLSCRKELKFWFNSIEMRCHEAVPVAIIGTRKDRISALSDHEKISEELEKLFKGSRLWSSIIHYYHEDSSKELNFFPINNKKWRVSTTVNQLLLKIDRTLNDAEYLKEEVPIIWMKVFDSMKATGKCALSYEEFTTIMKSKMVKEQGEATPGNAFAPTNGIFIAQYDEEKRKEMLRFLNSRGMALWIEEEGLQDIVILDPIEYFVRPATSIICKHIATKDDPSLTKHEIPEIHGKSKSALAEDWMRMIEYGMLSKRLVEDILNRFYDNAQQRRRIIGSSAVDHKNRNEEAMKKILLLMVKYGLMVPIMINGEQSSFFIPSLLPANPSLLLLDDQRLHQRLMQRYELLSSPYTSSMTFSFFFHLPDTFEKLQSEGYSIFSGVEISELGFLPYGLFERLVKPFVERIVEPLNHSQSSDEVMLQLLKDNRLIIGFRDKIQFTYHHHKVRLTNRLSESRIEVEVESHTTREDTEEDRRKDRVVTAKIYEDLIQMIEKVLKECYASLQIMTLIPLPVSLVKKPVPSLTSSKNNNINTQHETQAADCEVFISLSQVRKLLSVCEESNEERESRDFLSRDGHLVSLQPMMMKRDSYWSIWRTNMINTSSPPPLPLPPPRPLLPGKKTHVFLSHDWGIDDRNHRRVKHISDALKMRGFIPWIDDERLVNVVDERIVDGMDYTEVLLIFLTENYQRKVNGRNSQDYCQREFFYGMDKLRKERTIVVVLDSSLTDTSTWTGLFRFNLTGVLYQNLSNVFREDGEEVTISEEEVNGKIDGLCEAIERVRSENTPRDDV